MRIAMLLLAAALLNAQQPTPTPAKGINFYSLEKEIALGKSLADDVLRQVSLVDDPAIVAYLNGLAQRLAVTAGAEVPVTVYVVDDPTYNSFVLPGGFLFVNTGLLENTANEAELAAVLSHQIAHVAARHGTKQETRGQIATLANVPLIFQGSSTGNGIRQEQSLAIPMGFLAFSRAFEHEADALGLQALYQAGYDPNAYFAFFDKIQALEAVNPSRVSRVFATHPPTEDRITRTQQNLANLAPRAGNTINTPEFDRMRARLAELPKQPAPIGPARFI